jgi:hypothetical protein
VGKGETHKKAKRREGKEQQGESEIDRLRKGQKPHRQVRIILISVCVGKSQVLLPPLLTGHECCFLHFSAIHPPPHPQPKLVRILESIPSNQETNILLYTHPGTNSVSECCC